MKKTAVYVACALMLMGCFAFFGGCTKDLGLTYAVSEDACSVFTGTNCNKKDLEIPAEYEGKPVTGVSEYAFVRNYSLTSVTLPENATFIDDGAFYGCPQLATVRLPATLDHIGYRAFCHCEKLETIRFGGTKEQWYAMERMYLWDEYSGAYSIVCADGTIEKARNGNDLGTPGLLYEIHVRTGHGVLENGLNTEAQDVEVSAKYYNFDVTEIGERAFAGAEIKSVKLPEGVGYIDDEAFKNCALLQKVYLPSSLNGIGRESFAECPALTDIYFADTRERWNDVTKDPSWNTDTSVTVHCTDDHA